MSKSHPLAALTRARFLEFIREPEALFWVFVFPLVMALVLGFAFRDKPPEPIPIGVIGRAGPSSLAAALSNSAALKTMPFTSMDEGHAALRTGKIVLLVQDRSPVVYEYDPTRPDSRVARLEVDAVIQRAGGRADPVPVRDEQVHERGSRYIDFLVPGLLGLNLLSTSVWGIGFGIVNARMRKTLKLMTATPMRRSDYLLSHVFSRFAFLAIESTAIITFGVLAFGVPVRCDPATLVFLCVFAGLSFTGLGLLCGSRVQTFEGVNGLINAILVPMWLLSGVFFSSERFPKAFQPLIRALPLTAANEALRAAMLEGRGLLTLAAPLAILLVWAIATYTIALKIFRWQ